MVSNEMHSDWMMLDEIKSDQTGADKNREDGKISEQIRSYMAKCGQIKDIWFLIRSCEIRYIDIGWDQIDLNWIWLDQRRWNKMIWNMI